MYLFMFFIRVGLLSLRILMTTSAHVIVVFLYIFILVVGYLISHSRKCNSFDAFIMDDLEKSAKNQIELDAQWSNTNKNKNY